MKLTLGWLYYDLMNTYGDRGNVLILKERAQRRKINLTVLPISINSSYKSIAESDILLMGGAEDRQQKIVASDLTGNKEKALQEAIAGAVPGLYICGAYQFLGEYYEAADGSRIQCLNMLPFHTKHPGTDKPRLIGDLAVKITHPAIKTLAKKDSDLYMVGFENHGGRTYVDNNSNTIGTVLKGYGNNDKDALEGYVHNNTIGTYSHGPILPRNPLIADFLLSCALKRKYKEFTGLEPLTDELTEKNRLYLLRQLRVVV